MSLQSGTQLGPHEISSLIGAGGMGEVYRARDTRLGQTVALKLPRGGLAAPLRLKGVLAIAAVIAGEAARLRAGEAAGDVRRHTGARLGRGDRSPEPRSRGHGPRHAAIHVARATGGQGSRRARTHVARTGGSTRLACRGG